MAEIPAVQTIRYKLYVKRALVEAMRAVFTSHADELLRRAKVGIDFPLTEIQYPAIVVRFYEREIKNAGVGHFEVLPALDANGDEILGQYLKYKHFLYNGDIEFAVYALSSFDRDIISDSIVQTLTMGDLEPYTDEFLTRIYGPDPRVSPEHFINLNTDKIQGFGETQMPAPWQPEDILVYQTSYRIPIFGEFYNRTPTDKTYGLVERVDTFPYNEKAGEARPEPGWAGPDGVYGTADDQADPAAWE